MIETHLFIHLFLHKVDCVDYTLFVVCYPFSNIKTIKTVGYNLKLLNISRTASSLEGGVDYFLQSAYFQNAPASSSQKMAPRASSFGLSLSSSALGPTTFSLNPPAPTAFMGSSIISLTSAPWRRAASAFTYPSLQ